MTRLVEFQRSLRAMACADDDANAGFRLAADGRIETGAVKSREGSVVSSSDADGAPAAAHRPRGPDAARRVGDARASRS